MNFRDVELLSEYLDGRLKPSDAARVEARLSTDPALKATFEDLRATRTLLRRLPQRRAPRSFRLTPKMAGVRPPEPRSYPAFRFATALAAFLFVAAVALNAFTPFAARHLAPAAAPAYGMGGGGGGPIGGGDETLEAPQAAAPAATQAPAATEEPTLQAFTAIMPTATPEIAMSAPQATEAAPQADSARATGEATNKAAPPAGTSLAQESQAPVPMPLVIGLGVLMLVFAVAAWVLRRSSERRIRGQWNQK